MFRKTLFQNKYFKNIKNPLSFFRKLGRYQNLFFREFSRSIGTRRLYGGLLKSIYGGKSLKFRRVEAFYLENNSSKKDYTKEFIEACEGGYVWRMKWYLANGEVDINRKDENGQTALHLAVTNGFPHTAKLLTEQKNIDINAKDNEGLSPADLGLKKALGLIGGKPDPRCFLIFLETRKSVLDTPVYMKKYRRLCGPFGDIIEHVKRHGFDSTIRAFYKKLHFLEEFCTWNEDELEEYYHEYTLLKLAVKDSRDIDILIYSDKKLNFWLHGSYYCYGSQDFYITILDDAILEHNKKAEYYLRDRDVDARLVTSSGDGRIDYTEDFMKAYDHLNLAKMKWYLANGKVDLSLKDENEQTVLHKAAANGHSHSVESLIKQEGVIDLTARDNKGETPAHLALKNALGYVGEKSNPRCIQALLKTGECCLDTPKSKDGEHVKSPAGNMVEYIRKYGFDGRIRAFYKLLHLAHDFSWGPKYAKYILKEACKHPRDFDILEYSVEVLKLNVHQRYYSGSRRGPAHTLVNIASWNKNQKAVDFLVSNGAKETVMENGVWGEV